MEVPTFGKLRPTPGYELYGRGSISGRRQDISLTSHRPDRPWASQIFLFSGFRGYFPEDKAIGL
jgi:hypothetical protein